MKDLVQVLKSYGINGEVIRTNDGPLIKQIEFLPDSGTKIKNITSSIDDIAREMGLNSLRVETVENSNNVGFEIPQDEIKTIDFLEILNSKEFENAKGNLPICLGVDITGKAIFEDLSKMPHLLVAGTTGSGKSVGLNTFILSLIKNKTDKDLKFVLIDPKRIEFSAYNNQSYMFCPVVTENGKANNVLQHLVAEMNKRYALFEETMSKNIESYREKGKDLPYIVCVIDEFADLVASNKEVEKSIQMLAQKARASGIHIVLATQRPSVDVVTGVLKANFPTRMSYKVASSSDSRTILDTSGAEKLIGRGDSLYLASDGNLKRIHGAYVKDSDIEKLLSPYRKKIADIVFEDSSNEIVKTNIKTEKEKKSIFRKSLEWWSSLKVRERKTIITFITSVASYFMGYLQGSKKRR